MLRASKQHLYARHERLGIARVARFLEQAQDLGVLRLTLPPHAIACFMLAPCPAAALVGSAPRPTRSAEAAPALALMQRLIPRVGVHPERTEANSCGIGRCAALYTCTPQKQRTQWGGTAGREEGLWGATGVSGVETYVNWWSGWEAGAEETLLQLDLIRFRSNIYSSCSISPLSKSTAIAERSDAANRSVLAAASGDRAAASATLLFVSPISPEPISADQPTNNLAALSLSRVFLGQLALGGAPNCL